MKQGVATEYNVQIKDYSRQRALKDAYKQNILNRTTS